MPFQKSERDLIDRGNKSPSPLGTTTFVGLRALDPVIQYAILSGMYGSGLITTLGSSVLSQGASSNTGTILDSLQLSPYRLALVGMSAAAFVKQAYWQLFLSGESLAPSLATLVSFFNTLHSSVNSLLFLATATSAAKYVGEGPESSNFPGTPLAVGQSNIRTILSKRVSGKNTDGIYLGSTVFITGALIELVSEMQRARFKKDSKNQGKPYTGGLWATSRHINYFGYMLWRSGYALAAGGWIFGGVIASFFAYDFITRTIPALEDYCEHRYADLWHLYQERTPYKFVPFVY